MLFSSLLSLSLASGAAQAAPAGSAKVARQNTSPAVVNFGNLTGASTHVASGAIFGVPDFGIQNQIPGQYYTGIDYGWGRGGGAQMAAPNRGYFYGADEYTGRWADTLVNYNTVKQYGAKFQVLMANLYGDFPNGNTFMPGDDGNWTSWDAMTQQMISDMKAANVDLSDFVVEIINEFDGGYYWTRSEAQGLELWRRTYVAVREAFGDAVQILGPSSAGEPGLGNGWWTQWAQFIVDNNVVPDIWSWHMEGGGGNMLESTANLHELLDHYNLPYNTVNINEYGTSEEQVPPGSAWWIAQLERVDIAGMRGNWLSNNQLRDFMANLLTKTGMPDNYVDTDADYSPVGDWWVYNYYATVMTGQRVGTVPSGDNLLDVYATVDQSTNTARVLLGVRTQTGTWNVELSDLSALGLPESGSITIDCVRFDNNGKWGGVSGRGDCGTLAHSYSGNSLTLPVFQTDTNTAYAFEFKF